MVGHVLRIGEVAARAGVSTRTVDYYSSLGLIAPAARTDGSYRLYEPGTVERIGIIRRLEGLGISLDDIARPVPGDEVGGLMTLLDRLCVDVYALRDGRDPVDASTRALVLTAVTRAHQLVVAALGIAAGGTGRRETL